MIFKKYFSWNELFKKFPKYKKAILQVVLSERNIGKTFSTFEYIINNKGFTKNNKVLFLRNTDKELIHSKKDFANRFKKQLVVKGDFIYNVEKRLINNEFVYCANELVGYFASVNNYVNYKSLEAKDIKYVFYEEFNEDTNLGKNLYFKFFNILKTFERFNKLKYVFMLGNKDNFNNDYFINWEITPNLDKQTQINEIKDNIGLIGVVYDFGCEEFKNIDNNLTLSNRLGNLDNRTKNYVNSGYNRIHSLRVLNYKKIMTFFKPKFYLVIGFEKYIFGDFDNNYAIISPWNFDQSLNLKCYSFDLLSGLKNDAAILDQQDHLDLIDFIYKNEKANNIYYDSYDNYNTIIDLIYTHKHYLM